MRAPLRGARGFCNHHVWQFADDLRDGLGTAIIYRDILGTLLRTLESPLAAMVSRAPFSCVGILLGKGSGQDGILTHEGLANRLSPESECPACQSLASASERDLDTLVAYLADEELRERLLTSGRLCVPHLADALARVETEDDIEILTEAASGHLTCLADWAPGSRANVAGIIEILVGKDGAVQTNASLGLAEDQGALGGGISLDVPAMETVLEGDGCPICKVITPAVDKWLRHLAATIEDQSIVEQGLSETIWLCNAHTWRMLAIASPFAVAKYGAMAANAVADALAAGIDHEREMPLDILGGLLGLREPDARRMGKALAAKLRPYFHGRNCPACKVKTKMERIATLALLDGLRREEVVAEYSRSAGLCLSHFGLSLRLASDRRLKQNLLSSQIAIYRTLLAELDEFVRKQDYRFRDEPWGRETDSPWRPMSVGGQRMYDDEAGLLELVPQLRRAKVCPGCRREWPVHYNYCSACAMWLGGSERDVHEVKLAPTLALLKDNLPPDAVLDEQTARDLPGRVVELGLVFVDLVAAQYRRHDDAVNLIIDLAQSALRYGGAICPCSHEGLVAVFVADVAGEDHIWRTLRAALAMRRALGLRETGYSWGIGANAGMVVVDPQGEPPLCGRSLDLAKRLAQAGQPDGLLVAPGIFHAAERSFDFVGIGQPLWGDPNLPSSLFALLGEKDATSHQQVVSMDTAPLVGRRAELRALQQRLASAKAGQTEFVSLIAEPGGGKSKLVHEFLLRAQGEGDLTSVTCLHGYGASYGGGPYWLFRGMLETYLDVAPGDGPAARRAKLDGGTAELGLDHSAISALAVLLGIEDRAQGRDGTNGDAAESQITNALLDLLSAESRRQPLLVIIDDLHWVDEPSLQLVRSLVERLEGLAALVILAYRHSFSARVEWLSRRNHLAIPLPPLSGGERRELLSALVGLAELPKEAQALLSARTKGNPLHLEEAVALLEENGTLVKGENGWTLARKIDEADVPDTLHGTILRRIEWLDRQQAGPLRQRISWLGHYPYERSRLVKQLEDTEARIGAWLDRLETGAYADRAEIGAYLHRLEQIDFEITMASTLLGRPRPRNQRLAQSIERLHAGSFEEHYNSLSAYAGRTGDNGNVAYQAAAAGDRAARMHAVEAAAKYYRLALEMSNGDVPGMSHASLLEKLGDVYALQGDAGNAAETYRVLLTEGSPKSGDNRLSARLKLAHALMLLGDIEGAEAYIDEVEASARQGPSLEMTAWPDILAERAAIAIDRGDHLAALSAAQTSMEGARSSTQVVRAWDLVAQAQRALGQWDQAENSLREMVLAVEEAGPTANTVEVYLALAAQGASGREPPAELAACYAERALHLARSLGSEHLAAQASYWLGEIRYAQGRWEEAATLWENCVRTYDGLGIAGYSPQATAGLERLRVERSRE